MSIMNTKDISAEYEGEKIFVTIKNPQGSFSFTNPHLFIVLTPDQADRLAFQVNSALQDMELTKGEK